MHSKYEIIRVKNNLTFVNCTNINNKTYSEELIFIIGNSSQQSFNENSYVNFNNAKISSNYVTVSGEIYKGDTSKTLFSFYFQCKNKDKKTKKSSELKIYLNEKFSTQKFSYKLPIKDQLEVCYSSPEISYSGLDLSGEIDVEGFERKEQEDKEVISADENNEQEITNVTNKTFEVFTYSKNNSSLELNPSFIAISPELFSIQTNNKTSSGRNNSQKITGHTVEENALLENGSFSFVNIIVMVLLIAVIGLILFKKW